MDNAQLQLEYGAVQIISAQSAVFFLFLDES